MATKEERGPVIWMLYYRKSTLVLCQKVADALLALKPDLDIRPYWMDYEAMRNDVPDFREGDVAITANWTFAARREVEEANLPVYHIHHGVGSNKNHTYHVKPKQVVSEFVASWYAVQQAEARGIDTSRQVPLGYVQMDSVRQGKATGKTILLAPTWNQRFCSHLRWVREFIENHAGYYRSRGYKIVVAMHPHTDKGSLTETFDVVNKYDNVECTSGEDDVTDHFDEAAVLIGDTGSALFMFLATGRPVIAYNSWEWWKDRHGAGLKGLPTTTAFDTEDDSYRWRDVFLQFTATEEARIVVDAALEWAEKPSVDPMRSKRLSRCDLLFGSNQGRVAEAIAQYIIKDVEKRFLTNKAKLVNMMDGRGGLPVKDWKIGKDGELPDQDKSRIAGRVGK